MFNPSRYRIIAFGKVKKDWLQAAISSYLKRLPGLTIKELRDSTPSKEASAIRASLNKGDFLVVLSEEYETFSSVSFAKRLKSLGNKKLVFLIGGADGISTEIKNISSWNLSLSPLTFPHDIARLLLIEQIYRAQTILKGAPYHRGGDIKG
mgnify:CR=1 FL=1